MKFNLQRCFRFGTTFFTRVGKVVLKRHRGMIFGHGVNAAENSFIKYSDKYRKRKVAGNLSLKSPQKSFSGKPDLTLTGQMKDSFKYLKADKKGFEYGIVDPKMAERMEFQGPLKKSRKRFVSTKENPITPSLQGYVSQEMGNQVLKNFTKEIRKNKMGYQVYTI